MTYLSNFHVIRPQYRSLQKNILEWLASAHAKAESHKAQQSCGFRNEIANALLRVGGKPNTIEERGHEIADFLHEEWQKMSVYNLENNPQGASLEERQKIHRDIVDRLFERFYETDNVHPDHLIHVSCTGYSSPSSAQKLVSRLGWGSKTEILHVYHMGCYAAIPAIRIASAFTRNSRNIADIVHSELCSLHLNPLEHQMDKLVSQSLFADGFIKYTVGPSSHSESLKVFQIQEQVIPESIDAMSWHLTNYGFSMTLAKEIPFLIAQHVQGHVKTLCARVDLSWDEVQRSAIFAIHPGGPKIVDHMQDIFGLNDDQLRLSRSILSKYGNMSSATLPHIWEAICAGSDIPKGTKVVSLAFGPGLTIASILMEKA